MSRAREWAVRCTLEWQRHERAAFVTLTYRDQHLPPTLRKDHLSGWLKRLRARLDPVRIRFFACGEYGERTHRPHYHALVFGVQDTPHFRAAWPYGDRVWADPVTQGRINYVCGYVQKKFGTKEDFEERVDPETGEIYTYQPPFHLMSRGGRGGVGIGGHAREHWRSWRKTAIHKGREVPVPRYLHQAWLANATETQIHQLKQEKLSTAVTLTRYSLQAAEKIAESRLNLHSSKRSL